MHRWPGLFCGRGWVACGAGASINDLHTGDFRPDFLLQRVMGRPTLCFLPEGPLLEAKYEGLKAGMEKRMVSPGGRFTFSPHGFSLNGARETSVVNPTGFENSKPYKPPERTSNRKPKHFHPGANTPPIPIPTFGAPGWSWIPLFFCTADSPGREDRPSG